MYLELYILHPYLNLFLTRLTREEYKKFLTTAFVCLCAVPLLTGWPFGGNALIHFICLYSLSGWLRLWADDFGSRKFILYGSLIIMAELFTVYILDMAGASLGVYMLHENSFTRPLLWSGIFRTALILSLTQSQ